MARRPAHAAPNAPRALVETDGTYRAAAEEPTHAELLSASAGQLRALHAGPERMRVGHRRATRGPR
jgi:hypothetical protein